MRNPVLPLAIAALLAAIGCGDDNEPLSPVAPDPDAAAPAAVPDPSRFQTRITFGPSDGGLWSPDVTFEWSSPDAAHFEWSLLTREEYVLDTGQPYTVAAFIAWAESLSFHPDGSGGYDRTRPAWEETRQTATSFDDLEELAPDGAQRLYNFAVRARGRDGVEAVAAPFNFRRFVVDADLPGPRLFLATDVGEHWSFGDPDVSRELFAGGGLRFEWAALPGPSGTAPSEYRYSIDGAAWSAWSADVTSWPPGTDRWFPLPGPHTFQVEAVDGAGFVSLLDGAFLAFNGPLACPPTDSDVLVVLDTDPAAMQLNGFWPSDYAAVERALAESWFAGYNVRFWETQGTLAPTAADLECASSVFWFHSSDLGNGDSSVLNTMHGGLISKRRNILESYLVSGGNLFVCGIRPSVALRFFQALASPLPSPQVYPLTFEATLTDPAWLPHWTATRLGIGRIESSVGSTVAPSSEPLRLSVATSALPGTYPDLPFDPLRWPNGTTQGGFGFYDLDVRPVAGSTAEVAYTANDTGIPIAVRNTAGPPWVGKTFYLGLHPYFVDGAAFEALLQAVLTDFGETAAVRSLRGAMAGGR